jgi:hypothetical protein
MVIYDFPHYLLIPHLDTKLGLGLEFGTCSHILGLGLGLDTCLEEVFVNLFLVHILHTP